MELQVRSCPSHLGTRGASFSHSLSQSKPPVPPAAHTHGMAAANRDVQDPALHFCLFPCPRSRRFPRTSPMSCEGAVEAFPPAVTQPEPTATGRNIPGPWVQPGAAGAEQGGRDGKQPTELIAAVASV